MSKIFNISKEELDVLLDQIRDYKDWVAVVDAFNYFDDGPHLVPERFVVSTKSTSTEDEIINLDVITMAIGFLGDEGVRDPEHPCEFFSDKGDKDEDCDGDGHYLCLECIHYNPEEKDL